MAPIIRPMTWHSTAGMPTESIPSLRAKLSGDARFLSGIYLLDPALGTKQYNLGWISGTGEDDDDKKGAGGRLIK